MIADWSLVLGKLEADARFRIPSVKFAAFQLIQRNSNQNNTSEVNPQVVGMRNFKYSASSDLSLPDFSKTRFISSFSGHENVTNLKPKVFQKKSKLFSNENLFF